MSACRRCQQRDNCRNGAVLARLCEIASSMKITHSALYAVQVLMILASQEQDRPHHPYTMARTQGVSEARLRKLLQPLVRAGILQSLKGLHGGYRLARNPRDITLLEVVEAIEGPVRVEVPGVVHQDGNAGLYDRLEEVCNRISRQTLRQLHKVRIADLIGEPD
jgi:Rrf2 family protein